MSIAAVPDYLDQDFKNASPGMRFGMYFPIWLHDCWEKSKNLDWESIACISQADRKCLNALLDRQRSMASKAQHVFFFHAQATAPFTTGLGNEHPLENGFSFLWPYGLPYLPGSGVKGVLRQAARELAEGLWGDTQGWSDPIITALFGSEDSNAARRGALAFWDVIPEIQGNRLMVEIMTPHQKHYYQDGEPPHDSGQPTPICFLTVPPGSKFAFHVVCDRAFLRRLAPELVEDDRWRALIEAAFQHAFDWLGFGAKTAVGYGAMRLDPEVEQRRREAEARRRAEEERRRKEEEAAREAEARRRAFEALPSHEKARIQIEKQLKAFPETGPLNKDRYSELLALINPHIEAGQGWAESERHALADYLEDVFDRLGWHPSGLRRDKREKQEKKRRELLQALRNGRSR